MGFNAVPAVSVLDKFKIESIVLLVMVRSDIQ